MPKHKKDQPNQVLGPLVSESNGHRLEFDEKSHRYRLDGIIVPGVTTVIKAYPTSQALINWMVKQGIEERLSGEKLKRAANIGSIVHELIEKSEGGKPYEVPDIEEVKACWKAYETFRASKPMDEKILAAEEVIASPSKGYAGKFDSLIQAGDKITIRDFKTTSGIYASAWFQCGLYSLALREWKGIEVDQWQIVRFGKSGEFVWHRDAITISDKKAMKDYTDQALRCLDTYFFMQKYDAS